MAHQLGGVVGAELVHQPAAVIIGGFDADRQVVGDLLGGVAVDDEMEVLARGAGHPQLQLGFGRGEGELREPPLVALLHDPVYREKYAQNLKREFPRIPCYPDFWQWADWGKTLMDLHIGYETVEPWPLQRTDVQDKETRKAGLAPKPVLKPNKEFGRIRLDSETTLAGFPAEVWDYKLGNRSALEWILDQYKEKKPKDPTIRARFDTYRFADYKEKVIDLLARVTTVSVETVRITREMLDAKR